jgi:hypothetical protein
VGPEAGLDRCGKSRPTGIRSPDLPARSERYTDYAIPAPPNRIKHQFYFSLQYKPHLLMWTKIVNLARKK